MKKIIIAMCGLLIAGEALASEIPHKTSVDGATNWKVGGGYSANVAGAEQDYSQFTPGYQLNSRAGTFGDTANGSIVAVIANTIYENGGRFCTTQIQAGNSSYTLWIDYYQKDGFHCLPICKPGYYGDTCSETTPNKCDKDTDFTQIFNQAQYDARILSGNTNGRITNQIDVFEYDEPGSAKEKANIVLGVVKRLKHGVLVAPVRVVGRRNGNIFDIDTRIISTHSNAANTLLCAAGYKANTDKSDCIPGIPLCETDDQIPWCPGYDGADYNSDQYTWEQAEGCKIYRCKLAGYGFKNSTDKTCELCGTDVRSGALKSTGVCTTCPVGKCFKNGECGGCTEIPKLKIERGPNYDSQNRECWRKTNPDKFWGCVMCPDEDQCYNKNSSGRYECGTCPTE